VYSLQFFFKGRSFNGTESIDSRVEHEVINMNIMRLSIENTYLMINQ
jgi:hypothetical protein